MKQSTLILTLAAILAIGAGCASTTTKNTNTTKSATTNTVVNTGHIVGSFSTSDANTVTTIRVTITASGIDRPSVTIAAGTRVEFLNGDTAVHILYADPHPTHTSLPAFGGSITPGAVSAYTFLDKGTFTYHDDMAPTNKLFQGKVVVE